MGLCRWELMLFKDCPYQSIVKPDELDQELRVLDVVIFPAANLVLGDFTSRWCVLEHKKLRCIFVLVVVQRARCARTVLGHWLIVGLIQRVTGWGTVSHAGPLFLNLIQLTNDVQKHFLTFILVCNWLNMGADSVRIHKVASAWAARWLTLNTLPFKLKIRLNQFEPVKSRHILSSSTGFLSSVLHITTAVGVVGRVLMAHLLAVLGRFSSTSSCIRKIWRFRLSSIRFSYTFFNLTHLLVVNYFKIIVVASRTYHYCRQSNHLEHLFLSTW